MAFPAISLPAWFISYSASFSLEMASFFYAASVIPSFGPQRQKRGQTQSFFFFFLIQESCMLSLGFLTRKTMPCVYGEKHSRGWKIASEVLREGASMCSSLPVPRKSGRRSLNGARHLLGISRPLFIFLSHTSAAHGCNKDSSQAQTVSH